MTVLDRYRHLLPGADDRVDGEMDTLAGYESGSSAGGAPAAATKTP